MTAIALLSVAPVIEGSMSGEVAKAVAALDDFDVSYETNPMGTVIEADDAETLFAAAAAAHDVAVDGDRVSTVLKIDDNGSGPEGHDRRAEGRGRRRTPRSGGEAGALTGRGSRRRSVRWCHFSGGVASQAASTPTDPPAVASPAGFSTVRSTVVVRTTVASSPPPATSARNTTSSVVVSVSPPDRSVAESVSLVTASPRAVASARSNRTVRLPSIVSKSGGASDCAPSEPPTDATSPGVAPIGRREGLPVHLVDAGIAPHGERERHALDALGESVHDTFSVGER